MKIGKSKYGSTQKKYWKLKDGESVFRILPPLGELADEGRWSVFYNVHYGYKNAAGKSRPFVSPLVKNRTNGIVEIPDAASERIEKLKAELAKAKAAGDKKGQETLLKLVGGAKSIYNLDNNHYVNAIDEQGNIGVLKLRHRAKQALDAEIKKLRDKGIDPLSVENGRFFSFYRTGNAFETSFQVTVKKQTVLATVGNEQIQVEKDLVHVLTDELISRLSNEAAELRKIFRTPSAEQVAEIVGKSDLRTGTVEGIDEILGFNTQNSTSAAQTDEGYEDNSEEEVSTNVETKAPTVAEAPIVSAKVETPVTKVETASSPQTTASKLTDMSVDEFLASLEKQ
jgi:hypothetical protein